MINEREAEGGRIFDSYSDVLQVYYMGGSGDGVGLVD